MSVNPRLSGDELRRGWTTGACATAAAKAAVTALWSDDFPDPVSIDLPKGQQPAFALAYQNQSQGWAEAGIIKDAGDDPDVTHGVLVKVRAEQAWPGSGLRLKAGEGIGIVTKKGLPITVGKASLTPIPRQLIENHVLAVCDVYKQSPDVRLTISIPGGKSLARQTWNGRLGIIGGLSILGTTGVVVPYSCSAWIHSIHRGVDVAMESGLQTLAACTGSMSEQVAKSHYGLESHAMIDMGDFVGALLKYIKKKPCETLIIAGGFAKMCKLAQGYQDLHSGRSQLDMHILCQWIETLEGDPQMAKTAESGAQILQNYAHLPLGNLVAAKAKSVCESKVSNAVKIRTLVCDRFGKIVGSA